jgi:purine catabolism regulator
MLPSLGEVLAMEVCRRGCPAVVAGADRLDMLRDDPRLQTFVERELGALLADPGLVDVLAAYLTAGGNKAEAAKASHLARPTFYERLRRIERTCGTDLSSAESRTSLHVALLALNASRSGASA